MHALVWAEAAERGLDRTATLELLRRCEVVLAGVTLQHETHLTWIPAPHGGYAIRRGIAQAGRLDVADLAEIYTPNRAGFGGAYLGSELRLGLAENGRPPTAGPRADLAVLREALGGIVDLAVEDTLELRVLAGVPHLCACPCRARRPRKYQRRGRFPRPEHR